MPNRKNNDIILFFNNLIVDLPSPSSISYMWNFGSLLGICLVTQLITGIFLAMHYSSDSQLAFITISHIMRDVNYGWLMRVMHANGASMFFLCLYLHISRGLYFASYLRIKLWYSGIIILILVMGTAFLGYVLPWGQMSFWGATVITNFASAIPYIGNSIVNWLWGGFSVGKATLSRFFSLHYLLPFIIAGLVFIHLILLHEKGSNNPNGVGIDIDKVSFYPYFIYKDIYGGFLFAIIFSIIIYYYPFVLGDPENFITSNPLVTPIHIVPEWYFLFAYAILRAIPNKLGGLLALVFSLLILFVVPFLHTSKLLSLKFKPLGKILFWVFISNFTFLTWLGAKPVEQPYIIISQWSSFLYFSYFLIAIPTIGLLENKLMNYYMLFLSIIWFNMLLLLPLDLNWCHIIQIKGY